ncbi:MAG: type II toxin-antitoxin system HicA family toxin, partial [Halapricum sp.]
MKVLDSFGYERDRQRGSHVVLKYRNPDTDDVRTVTVPPARPGEIRDSSLDCRPVRG